MAKFLDNWKNKVTTYKNKAEEIRAMIEEGAETIRDIRADVEGTVEDLKADSEEKMMESLEKIQDSERVFKEAGYLLSAIELEMGFNPKVVAVLKRESEIGSRKKERLLKQHEDNKLLSTVLTSLFKAEALEDKVHLRRLTFSEVHIEMGLVPAVHVLWEDKAASGISTDAILPIEESSSGSKHKGNDDVARDKAAAAATTRAEHARRRGVGNLQTLAELEAETAKQETKGTRDCFGTEAAAKLRKQLAATRSASSSSGQQTHTPDSAMSSRTSAATSATHKTRAYAPTLRQDK